MSKSVVEKIFEPADIKINGERDWDIQVLNENFYPRILKDAGLALGETYMEGFWTCKSIDQMIEKVLRNNIQNAVKLGWLDQMKAAFSIIKSTTNQGSGQAQLMQHYDIGNELYQAMLDPSMQYTCAYWRNGATSLEKAQIDKMDMVCKKLNLKQDHKMLDLGCGWGGLMRYAFEKYKVTAVGYNLSKAQIELGKSLSKDMTISFIEGDFCDTSQSIADGNLFDAISSIGCLEHCGPSKYQQFMKNAYNCLKDDGVFVMHFIARLEGNSASDPFFEKYIFPGGYLPSISEISTAMGSQFVIEDIHNFGEDYAKTLLAWYTNFQNAWESLSSNSPDKYTETFKRMWEYYLLSCVGSFKSRNIQLLQIVATKTGSKQPTCRYGGVASNPIDNGSR